MFINDYGKLEFDRDIEVIGYLDGNGIEHESYEAACHYYGADTPAQIAAEHEYFAALEREAMMDRMMAGEVQPGAYFSGASWRHGDLDDDIPF